MAMAMALPPSADSADLVVRRDETPNLMIREGASALAPSTLPYAQWLEEFLNWVLGLVANPGPPPSGYGYPSGYGPGGKNGGGM
jgi:hypothetical protein